MLLLLFLIIAFTNVKPERKQKHKEKETRLNNSEMQANPAVRQPETPLNSMELEDGDEAPRGRSRTRRPVWYNE